MQKKECRLHAKTNFCSACENQFLQFVTECNQIVSLRHGWKHWRKQCCNFKRDTLPDQFTTCDNMYCRLDRTRKGVSRIVIRLTLASLVELPVDDVLGHVGACLGAKPQTQRLKFVLRKSLWQCDTMRVD